MNRHTRVIKSICEMHPDAECELHYKTPFQLLIATILSAQTTDIRVNIVTKELFRDYGEVEKMANVSPDTLRSIIRSIGFYNSKSENIIKTSKILIEEYHSSVPEKMEELIKLPGVGRKTANVVLSNAFGIPAFAVDTHVKRVSYRLGLTKSTDPDIVEKDITSKIPKYMYTKAHHAIIFHGRRMCKAQKPECDRCMLTSDCNYFKNKGVNNIVKK
ncbi:endonuclease III [Proteocatella sphenisci]|uniref:endonuclease III n=1 Tax=Proteocatella sphenisci TaxID=181070 RepID=UPI00048AB744|nr:endonuclease III [Proteocatella sphenisci]